MASARARRRERRRAAVVRDALKRGLRAWLIDEEARYDENVLEIVLQRASGPADIDQVLVVAGGRYGVQLERRAGALEWQVTHSDCGRLPAGTVLHPRELFPVVVLPCGLVIEGSRRREVNPAYGILLADLLPDGTEVSRFDALWDGWAASEARAFLRDPRLWEKLAPAVQAERAAYISERLHDFQATVALPDEDAFAELIRRWDEVVSSFLAE